MAARSQVVRAPGRASVTVVVRLAARTGFRGEQSFEAGVTAARRRARRFRLVAEVGVRGNSHEGQVT